MSATNTHPYDRYIAAINHADFDRRLAGLGEAAVDSFSIRSPAYEAHGLSEVCTAVGAAMGGDGPRVEMRRASAIDEHHGIGRVVFAAFNAAGTEVGRGMHIFEQTNDKLTALAVFLGAAPS